MNFFFCGFSSEASSWDWSAVSEVVPGSVPEVLETSDEAVSSGFSDASGSGFSFFLLNLEKKPFFFGGSSEASQVNPLEVAPSVPQKECPHLKLTLYFAFLTFRRFPVLPSVALLPGTSAGFISSPAGSSLPCPNRGSISGSFSPDPSLFFRLLVKKSLFDISSFSPSFDFFLSFTLLEKIQLFIL